MSHPRLVWASLAIAGAAFGLAAYTATQPKVRPSAAACDHVALEEEIARLRRELEAAKRVAAQGVVRRVADAASEPERPGEDPLDPNDPEAGVPPSVVATAPRYTRFDPPVSIEVEQLENGAISVRNTDPALANQVVMVKAEREDGTVDEVSVIIPPPS